MKHTNKADIAYAGFLLGGIFSLSIVFVSYLSLDNGQAGILGFVVLIPLSIIALLAMLVSIACTLVFHLDRQLKILAGFSVIFFIELVWEVGIPWFYNAMGLIYGLVATYLPIRWLYRKAVVKKTNT